MKTSIVLSTHAAQFEAATIKGDLNANLRKIAGWGYDGVELAIRDPKLVDADALVSALSAAGLRVPAIGTGQAWGEERLSFTSPDPKVRAAAITRIQSHIPLAAQLNAIIIIGLIRGITPAGQTHDQSMAYTVDAIQACAEAGARTGVRFALEPINRYETDLIHTAAEGMALIDRVGAANFGLLLDTFHMNIEEPDMTASIAACGSRLFHFHVADSNRWYPSAGHIDFPAIISTLKSIGYNGWISGEFLPKPEADIAAVRGLSYLKSIF